MQYKLRHFENNLQIISSLGWVLMIIGLIILFVGPIVGGLVFIVIGSLLVWFQLRGKRIKVDTQARTVKSGSQSIKMNNPSLLFMNEVRVSQTVNSRVNSTNVKMYFYKAYIQNGEDRILISCNRNDQRDRETLLKIAKDLDVPFEQNYE